MSILFLLLVVYTPVCTIAPALEHGSAPEASEYPSGFPVLAYHQITSVQSEYSATPFKLRDDLQRLYEAGFFLIQPCDLEDGLSRVPFHRRPLMITFDDGWEDNFRYTGEGADRTIDPNCAVAIVNQFLEEHPDFGQGVVFFVSWDKIPFGSETEEKLNCILDMGHALGNHTADHASFMTIPASMYSNQIIPALDSFRRRLGLRTSSVNTLAYPGGKLPAASGAELLLSEMEYQGRPAVVQGYLVDGSVENLSRLYESDCTGRYRISRIDMALYSVNRLLSWRNIMAESIERPSIHDPLPWRP